MIALQSLKDTFYVTLRDRLAALDATRVVTINGQPRPAIYVAENELANELAKLDLAECFALHWQQAKLTPQNFGVSSVLVELGCAIEYWTSGTDQLSSQDRGRALAALDRDLLLISLPLHTTALDYTQSPAATLAATVTWTLPEFTAVKEDGVKLWRTAQMTVRAILQTA